MEKRGGALIDVDRDALVARMKTYFDSAIDWATFKLSGSPLAKNAAGFDAKKARKNALKAESYDDAMIVRYLIRPFDVRFAYYTNASTIWNRSRPELWSQFLGDNRFVMSRPGGVARPEGVPVLFTRCLGDNDAQRGHSYYFPFEAHQPDHGMLAGEVSPNISAAATSYLSGLGLDPKTDPNAGEALWLHVLAICFSPKYVHENEDGLVIDWPRVPLPSERTLFDASVVLGRNLAAILDTEAAVPGVTSGTVLDHYKMLGQIAATDLRVTAGWGNKDTKGRVNPGQGKTEIREWSETEKAALKSGFAASGIDENRGFELLGRTIDVYLNATTYWRGVPEAVWEYFIGGYQVIKKWLSYRDETVLGRPLTKEEAREVTSIVRRLTAIVLLGDALNANYAAACNQPFVWSKPAALALTVKETV
jgi:Type ISP C-terminal specificity domain